MIKLMISALLVSNLFLVNLSLAETKEVPLFTKCNFEKESQIPEPTGQTVQLILNLDDVGHWMFYAKRSFDNNALKPIYTQLELDGDGLGLAGENFHSRPIGECNGELYTDSAEFQFFDKSTNDLNPKSSIYSCENPVPDGVQAFQVWLKQPRVRHQAQ